MVNRPANNLDNPRCVQHANFDGIHANVIHHRLNLGLQEFRRDRMNALHALGVLRGQRGQRGHAIATQGAEGFQIGLNARSAATIRAGNAEHAGVTMRQVWFLHAPNYAQRKDGFA